MSERHFQAIEDAADRLAATSRYEARNRLALLLVHAVIGIVVGFFLLRDGLPFTWAHVLTDLGWSRVFKTLPLVGGLTLLTGLLAGRVLVVEAVGMAVLLVWDLFAAVLVYRATHEPEAILPGSNPSLYPVAIYGGLGLLMTVHVVTLVMYLLGGRKRGSR